MKKFGMYFVVLFLVLGVSLFVPSPSVFAGTTSGSLSVSAAVPAICAVGSSSLSFGTYNPLGGGLAVNGSGTINVTCAQSVSYGITLGTGNAGGEVGGDSYAMYGGNGSYLGYNLYWSAAPSNMVVPNTLYNSSGTGGTMYPGSFSGFGTGTGGQQAIPIYGQISAGQAGVASGMYSDTVTITVTY